MMLKEPSVRENQMENQADEPIDWDGWEGSLIRSFRTMVKNDDTRELGKIAAIPNEYTQRDWINTTMSLRVDRREDVEECDGNQSGYDLVSCKGLTINSKVRQKTLHLENTRRASQKNIGAASKTGHVASSMGECDIYAFTNPCGFKSITEAEFLVIPAVALEDPKNPGYLRQSVTVKIKKKWAGKTREALELADKQKAAHGKLKLEHFDVLFD